MYMLLLVKITFLLPELCKAMAFKFKETYTNSSTDSNQSNMSNRDRDGSMNFLSFVCFFSVLGLRIF